MRVAAVGDNCVDVYEEQGISYPGGNPVNVAVYLQRMGIESSYTGVIGEDANGRLIIDSLRKHKVDVSHVRTAPGSTAITKVSLVDGNRVFGDYFEGVLANFALTDDDLSFLCDHDLVVSSIWGHTDSYLQTIKNSGTLIAFDYSDQPDDPLVETTLPYVDYAFFGLETTDSSTLREFLKTQRIKGPRCVIATLGEHGSLALDDDGFTKQDIVSCPVIDTMGAGDSYIAGFIKGVLEGRSTKECMELGAQSSAVTIGYAGAW